MPTYKILRTDIKHDKPVFYSVVYRGNLHECYTMMRCIREIFNLTHTKHGKRNHVGVGNMSLYRGSLTANYKIQKI